MKKNWDSLLTGLVLVRLGQELGTDSPLARAVFVLIEAAQMFSGIFAVDKF